MQQWTECGAFAHSEGSEKRNSKLLNNRKNNHVSIDLKSTQYNNYMFIDSMKKEKRKTKKSKIIIGIFNDFTNAIIYEKKKNRI